MVQFNVNLPAKARRMLRAVSALTGIRTEMIVSDAFRWYYDVGDSAVEQRRELCLATMERISKEKDLGFKRPLTPLECSAVVRCEPHDGMVRDDPTTRGAVAQSAERLNGIQEVRGSIPLGSIPAVLTSGNKYAGIRTEPLGAYHRESAGTDP